VIPSILRSATESVMMDRQTRDQSQLFYPTLKMSRHSTNTLVKIWSVWSQTKLSFGEQFVSTGPMPPKRRKTNR
jgi:hypothetical protein